MADMVRRGETNAENLVKAALDLIEKTDNQLKAWAYIDTAGAIASAKLLDEIRDSGRALGPLHGVPIGLKDIIDTADMPTEFGSLAFNGHQPNQDATITARFILAVVCFFFQYRVSIISRHARFLGLWNSSPPSRSPVTSRFALN